MDRSTRPLLALTAVALLSLAAVPCAAVAAPGDRPGGVAATNLDLAIPAVDAFDGSSLEPTAPVRSAETESEPVERGFVAVGISGLQSTPATPTRSQLYGVVIAVFLAVIGVAAWARRPDVLGRASWSRRWLPGVAIGDETDPNPLDAPDDGTLLTDEERILELLEENGGRLRQQNVVETTDWSKAKVSRLLSSMENDDAIVRIQLGREKLVFLSGHEPKGARSTLQEDS